MEIGYARGSAGEQDTAAPNAARLWDDHPPPHFHALYGEHEAQYNILTLDVIHGKLPRRAHALVVEWASLHKDELMKNWERCLIPAAAVPIDPLE
jgi:hypothetical protein